MQRASVGFELLGDALFFVERSSWRTQKGTLYGVHDAIGQRQEREQIAAVLSCLGVPVYIVGNV